MYHLPSKDGGYHLKLTLDLVQRIESEAGSLFKIADMLVDHELTLTDVIKVLIIAYREAGCILSDTDIATFLMQDSQQRPVYILSSLLVAILNPLSAIGAVKEWQENEKEIDQTA